MKIKTILFVSCIALAFLTLTPVTLKAVTVSITSVSSRPTICRGCNNTIVATASGFEGTNGISLTDGLTNYSQSISSGGSITGVFPASGSGVVTYTASLGGQTASTNVSKRQGSPVVRWQES